MRTRGRCVLAIELRYVISNYRRIRERVAAISATEALSAGFRRDVTIHSIVCYIRCAWPRRGTRGEKQTRRVGHNRTAQIFLLRRCHTGGHRLGHPLGHTVTGAASHTLARQPPSRRGPVVDARAAAPLVMIDFARGKCNRGRIFENVRQAPSAPREHVEY